MKVLNPQNIVRVPEVKRITAKYNTIEINGGWGGIINKAPEVSPKCP